MASITLTYPRLASNDDLSDMLTVRAQDVNAGVEERGETRWYAGGRKRYISSTGTARYVNLYWRAMEQDDREKLEGWLGDIVLWRDPRSRKLWGTISRFNETEIIGTDRCDVEFTITELTHSEVV